MVGFLAPSVYNSPRRRGLFMKPCWVQYLFLMVIVVLGTGSMLSACGQKGRLTLPDTPVSSETSEY